MIFQKTIHQIWTKNGQNINNPVNILLLGEENFSFSYSLQEYFTSQSNEIKINLIPTCYQKEIPEKFKYFVEKLKNYPIPGVDATDLSGSLSLESTQNIENFKNFDLVIFNFPHIGGKSNIRKNKNLLKNFGLSVENYNRTKNSVIMISLLAGQGGVFDSKVEREAYRERILNFKNSKNSSSNVDIPTPIYKNTWQITCQLAYANFGLTNINNFPLSELKFYKSSGYRGNFSLDPQNRSSNVQFMKENIGIVYVFSHFQDQLDNKKERDDRVILHPRTFTHDMSVNFKCLSDASSISVNGKQYIENTTEQLEKFLNEKFIDDMSVKICYLHKFECRLVLRISYKSRRRPLNSHLACDFQEKVLKGIAEEFLEKI